MSIQFAAQRRQRCGIELLMVAELRPAAAVEVFPQSVDREARPAGQASHQSCAAHKNFRIPRIRRCGPRCSHMRTLAGSDLHCCMQTALQCCC